MSKFDDQVMDAWDEWEALTGADANDPEDFVAWAMQNKKLCPAFKICGECFGSRSPQCCDKQCAKTQRALPTARSKRC